MFAPSPCCPRPAMDKAWRPPPLGAAGKQELGGGAAAWSGGRELYVLLGVYLLKKV